MRDLPLVAALAVCLGGCSLIFGDVDKGECAVDDDCPSGEWCPDGHRCVVGQREEPEPDAFEPEPDAFEPEPDAAPDAVPDQGPDADPTVVPFGSGADCFDGEEEGTFEPEQPSTGDLHVPRSACTPYARLWTAATPDALQLAWDTSGDGISEGRVRIDGRYAMGEGVVYLPRRLGADDRRQLVRVDLAGATESPVRVGAFDQWDPAYHAGRVAFVETVGASPPGVVVVEERDDGADRARECGAPDRAQWGPVLGPGFVAWFEQPVGSRRTRVVVLEGPSCEPDTPRRARTLDSALPPDARLVATDDGLLWIEPRPEPPGNHIRRWRFADPRAELESLYLEGRRLSIDPEQAPRADANPVELAAHGHRLAVVSYLASGGVRYALHHVDFTAPAASAVTRAPTDRDARAPWLSQTYLLWAEPAGFGDWRVAYARLE